MASLAELIYSGRVNDRAFDVISQFFLKSIYGRLGSFKLHCFVVYVQDGLLQSSSILMNALSMSYCTDPFLIRRLTPTKRSKSVFEDCSQMYTVVELRPNCFDSW